MELTTKQEALLNELVTFVEQWRSKYGNPKGVLKTTILLNSHMTSKKKYNDIPMISQTGNTLILYSGKDKSGLQFGENGLLPIDWFYRLFKGIF